MNRDDEREKRFVKMVADYPDSAIAHFSLGRLYLEQQQYSEAVVHLAEATKLDITYAAGLTALGDAYIGLGDAAGAKIVLERAQQLAQDQAHPGLAEEIKDRIKQL